MALPEVVSSARRTSKTGLIRRCGRGVGRKNRGVTFKRIVSLIFDHFDFILRTLTCFLIETPLPRVRGI